MRDLSLQGLVVEVFQHIWELLMVLPTLPMGFALLTGAGQGWNILEYIPLLWNRGVVQVGKAL